ncbi:hypothetical protein C1752_15929 [Acaryochloris thomasi RCC1774]|uniref:Uncharacterized protein n=1 Tax=Acaryochloris thomasi RCC1774 TaxID=1764569 RepID=A0A2W1JMV6_9CYAN|nr:hypothetical protein [Acaryochloris thomasi]PZD70237.1 hypothetical protein C1752_15929 [Acaryochloris thomasi RCC1774]
MAYRRSSQQLSPRRRSHRGHSSHFSKLQRHRQASSIDLLKQSIPPETRQRYLSHKLYINGVALPAHRIGSLAVVFREDCQGFQLFSWELRSPISSLLFDTSTYCYEAGVELQQRFDISGVLELQPFGSVEKVDAMIQVHQMREQVAVAQV